MNWKGLVDRAPDLATLGEQLFARSGLCLVGTLRKDGSPRISPCEVYIVDGELLLGMMWRSRKAKDLLRDPRLAVNSTQCDREASVGDFKAYGRVWDVRDPDLRQRYGDVVEATIDWRPEDPYHLFAVDLRSAGYISFAQDRRAFRWTERDGLASIKHPDA